MGSFISAVITDIGDLFVQIFKVFLRFVAKEKIAKLLYIVLYILSIVTLYNLPNTGTSLIFLIKLKIFLDLTASNSLQDACLGNESQMRYSCIF